MRLINTWTLRIEEFYNSVPPYAILSHTWGDSELTFQDWQSGNANTLPGFKKVDTFLRLAKYDEYRYAWIDTVCINKENSTELFEAINSMFNWYRDAEKCFAYLVDARKKSDMRESRWFRRGWTLQELLAPAKVAFYNSDWLYLGEKTDLDQLIGDVTRIPSHALTLFQPEAWTVAERMSWAANRETKRKEDVAYSLLGIFNVNIPLLYGEGDRAFIRLQEEIMRVSDDQSLFAWVEHNAIRESPCGLLATRPSQFLDTSVQGVQWFPDFTDEQIYKPYVLTNQGIQIQLKMIPFGHDRPRTFYAIIGHGTKQNRAAIVVKHLVRNEYARIHADTLIVGDIPTFMGSLSARDHEVFIKQRAPMYRSSLKEPYPRFWLEHSRLKAHNISITRVFPPYIFKPSDSILRFDIKTSQSIVYFSYASSGPSFTLRVDDNGTCTLRNLEFIRQSSFPPLIYYLQKSDASNIFFHSPTGDLVLVTVRSIAENPWEEKGKFYTVLLEAEVLPKRMQISPLQPIIFMAGLISAGLISYLTYATLLHYIHRNRTDTIPWSTTSILTATTLLLAMYTRIRGERLQLVNTSRIMLVMMKMSIPVLRRKKFGET